MVIVSIKKQKQNVLTLEQTTIGHTFDHCWNEQYQNNILLFKQTIQKIIYFKELVCKLTYCLQTSTCTLK